MTSCAPHQPMPEFALAHIQPQEPLGIRWTAGHVHPQGFEALQLSIWGAWKLFGPAAEYAVCVNSVPLSRAQELTGDLPTLVSWHDANNDLPDLIRRHLAPNMAEGVGWKFAPLRLFPDRRELALDNDCILWEIPRGLREWLAPSSSVHYLIAADRRRMLGKFEDLCGPAPRNSGIRGLPPGRDFEDRLQKVLTYRPVMLDCELDEQGLQVAAVTMDGDYSVVTAQEVTICSPFPPHSQQLGTCGAHFVGLNAWNLPWDWQGAPASLWTREHWNKHRDEIAARVGVH